MKLNGRSGRLAGAFLLAVGAFAQQPLRIIAFGAHPDDCDIGMGGTAALFAEMGHKVKFVSVTNGDAGHHEMGGGALAKRRYAETQEVAKRLGIAYDVLDNHDGELSPNYEVRKQIIRKIREWNADVVIGPRINDYHPDHRYTGMLVQDAAYMVVVPNVAPDTPALKKNPVFLYFQDRFQKPQPFKPDVVVAIDETFEKKVNGLDAHVSQFYEWLPWVEGKLAEVPKDPVERKKWLREKRMRPATPAIRGSAEKWYGPSAAKFQHFEAFEVAEYGGQPTEAELRRLFPMLKK
ncbi:MAG: PIG-L family deacetylase [Acidobacteria bacterium]|nr:PIG-L family deacetylase [Acidobacteriota bacterium]